jgi:hypothetical protein
MKVNKEELQNVLYQRAAERIASEKETMKSSFQERQDDLEEAEIKKRHHAKGGVTRHKRAKSEGEKSLLTGKSSSKRRQQGIKLSRTLRKETGSKTRIKNMKRKKAMRKKGA